MNNKILCIGDSLALPGHLNQYEDTWFYKVKKSFPQYDFISYFRRQLTTDVLVTLGGGEAGVDKWPKGADCLEAFNPSIVILQLGIVDCAPRLLKLYERVIIKHLPQSVSKKYIKIMKKLRLRGKNNTLVPIFKFRSNIENYLCRASKNKTKVIAISIALPDHRVINKNPFIFENTKKYNSQLELLSNQYNNFYLIKPLDPNFEIEIIYEDGYHPNNIGHELIFKRLSNQLSEMH